MSNDILQSEARLNRAVLWGVLLLVGGLIAGAVLGRSLATTSASSVPNPTVTVTAPAPDGASTWPSGPLSGPPESLEDLAHLPEYSGQVKDRTLAEAGGDTSTGNDTASGSGSGDGGSSSGGSTGSGNVDGDGSGSVDGGELEDFSLTASLQGTPILIGQTHHLLVRVTNPNNVAIQLSTVSIAAMTPAAAGCLPSWLTIEQYAGSPAISVPAGGSRQFTVDVRLNNLPTTNQDACKGVTFPLSLSGTART